MYQIDGIKYRNLGIAFLREDGTKGILPAFTPDQVYAMIQLYIRSIQEGYRREMPMHRDNKLGVKGVTRHGKGFRASVTIEGKQRHLGTFKTIEEAKQAVRNATSRAPTPASTPAPTQVQSSPETELQKMLRLLQEAEDQENAQVEDVIDEEDDRENQERAALP